MTLGEKSVTAAGPRSLMKGVSPNHTAPYDPNEFFPSYHLFRAITGNGSREPMVAPDMR